MTVRLTLRLPETVYERLVRESEESARSLNQVAVDALRVADLSAPNLDAMTPQERLNWALRDITTPWTDELDALMAAVFDDDVNAPVMSHEELLAAFPPLDPPLSQSVIDDREDRV